MAQVNVKALVAGGVVKDLAAGTVAEAKAALGLSGNYSALINGVPAKDSDTLRVNDFLSFSESVKGGC